MQESTKESVNEKLRSLSQKKAIWAALSFQEKLKLLKVIKPRILDNLHSLARVNAKVLGLSHHKVYVADAMIENALVPAFLINQLITCYESLAKHGYCHKSPTNATSSGQLVVEFPKGFDGTLKLSKLQLYMLPGKTASQGTRILGSKRTEGRVAVVIGAGNKAFLGLCDALHMMFVENCVVALKPHPILNECNRYTDHVMAPLTRLGYYTSISCDLDLAQHLLYHPLVDHVHMTGGTATHDAIVWGRQEEERKKRKEAGDPLLKVPITSELGCVSPWMVVPGAWSSKDLILHARHLVAFFVNNLSCNCIAPKVVVLGSCWEQRGAFIDRFKEELRLSSLLPPYYPGIADRYDAWMKQYPEAEQIHTQPLSSCRPLGDPLPWAVNVMERVPPEPLKEYAFRVEPFAPVITFLTLPCKDAKEYLEAVVPFVNDKLWGTLSCTLIVDSAAQRAQQAALDRAIQELRYGTVAVNSSATYSLLSNIGTWGGFPGGETLQDPGSGIGKIGNAMMYDFPEKAVSWAAFSGSQDVPKHVSTVPMFVVMIVCGLVLDGLRGIFRIFFFSK